ncbi:hypothetical protein [Bradyrhizobium lablabi]|uniref:hypothetical protein n=1 Tax=Bradyrhizobium lablabi TaxID=722472 RepID=UPI001BA90E90|nr:hypothetical protein [Bradyrhizobium lablabi]MBR0693478.1 hypothetical protein [Bradyrhizobium lablabi]
MGHQLAYRAAADGKHPVSKINGASGLFAKARRPAFAAVAFFMTALATTTSHAQSGPFAGLAGTWSGGGTVTLDDGSSERIRCRATYRVSGPTMAMSLTCASDAYKFNLQADVQAQGGVVTGTWSESSRNVGGELQGRGGGGNFQVLASAPGFNANISLHTSGNKQSVSMRADSQFRAANISLSK